MRDQSVGVLVARFQTYKLTDGHIYLLNAVLSKHEKVLLFLGVSPTKGTRRNPLPFKTRKLMVLEKFPKDKFPGLDILDINDVYNNKLWCRILDEKIESRVNLKKVLLYGSRDSFCRNYVGKFPVIELAPSQSPSGSDFREATNAINLQNESFRQGWIAACYDRYPTNYPTVDIIIFNSDKTKILLGRKSNDLENKYRTPGGFFDRNVDKSLEEAAVREVMEETGIKGVGKPIYIGSTTINDPRYTGEPDGILTSLFVIENTIGEVQASDDINELKWFDIKELLEKDGEQFIDYHKPLWEIFKNYIKKEV